ncbi:MAG TPA: hypothetical protein VF756_19730 [Thermoanaerobaculia bacterium]
MTAKEAKRLKAEAAATARQDAVQRAESRDAEIARANFDDEAAVREALLDDATAARLKEQVYKHAQDSHATEERFAALRAELGEERVSDEQLAAVEKLAAEITTAVETVFGQEKKLEEQIGRMKQRLARSKELREQLDIEEAALHVYDLLAGDLRSDKFCADQLRRFDWRQDALRSPDLIASRAAGEQKTGKKEQPSFHRFASSGVPT